MMNITYLYPQHTLLGVVVEGIPAFLSPLNALVNQAALNIIFQIAISASLFYLDHNLFALGFVVGFIFDKQVRTIVEKVTVVYNAHRTLLERVLFFGGGGFLAILTMPTSMVAATLYYSSQWGALLYQSSLARYSKTAIVPSSSEESDGMEPIIAPLTLSVDEKLETPREGERC